MAFLDNFCECVFVASVLSAQLHCSAVEHMFSLEGKVFLPVHTRMASKLQAR